MDIGTGFSLASLITSTCLNMAPATYNAACNGALTAGTKQSGIEKSVNDVQGKITTFADKESKQIIGEKPLSYLGGALFIKKIADERKVNLNLPKFVLYDSASTELSENSCKLNLQWNF